jgi:acylphosphatase
MDAMPHSANEVTVHVRVTGRVQGVGFREALRAEAVRLGVRGWVRNCQDGSVEAMVQGSPAAIEVLAAWMHRGPPAARVSGVALDAVPGPFDRDYAGFERLPSA